MIIRWSTNEIIDDANFASEIPYWMRGGKRLRIEDNEGNELGDDVLALNTKTGEVLFVERLSSGKSIFDPLINDVVTRRVTVEGLQFIIDGKKFDMDCLTVGDLLTMPQTSEVH